VVNLKISVVNTASNSNVSVVVFVL